MDAMAPALRRPLRITAGAPGCVPEFAPIPASIAAAWRWPIPAGPAVGRAWQLAQDEARAARQRITAACEHQGDGRPAQRRLRDAARLTPPRAPNPARPGALAAAWGAPP